MTLKDILDGISAIVDVVSDTTYYGKALILYTDAEKYKFIKEEKIYRMIKRRCVQEYRQITDPQDKENLRQKICAYLPKREQKQKS